MQIADPTIALPFIKLGVETPGTKGAVDFGKTLMSGAVALPGDATAHLPVGEGVAVPNVVELVDGALPPMADMDAETLLVIPDGITAAGWPDEPGNLPGDVLYAWQLVAHSAMSQLGKMAYGGVRSAQEPMGATAGDSSARPADAVVPGISGITSPQGLVQLPARAQTAPVVVMMDAVDRIEDAKRGAASASAERAAPVLGAWLERVQRRVENDEGQATVWLRDYRIDDASSASIINDIITFYGPSQPVWRIVVNGSEIWRRPSIQPGEG